MACVARRIACHPGCPASITCIFHVNNRYNSLGSFHFVHGTDGGPISKHSILHMCLRHCSVVPEDAYEKFVNSGVGTRMRDEEFVKSVEVLPCWISSWVGDENAL